MSFNCNFSVLSLNGLLVVYDPLHLISTWFAWIFHRISRNCFFFSNIFPYSRNRPWLEFPFISRHPHWTPKATQLKWFEQIVKSPTKYRALSFSTGLLCKETPVLRSAILLQRCTTSFSRHFLTLHHLGKKRQETCDLVNLIYQSGRTPVLEEAMTSRFYCFARKSQKINARKYGLSKKLDSRFHRSISENFKASLSTVPWARVGNFWQSESIKSLSFWKGLRRSRRHFDRHRM